MWCGLWTVDRAESQRRALVLGPAAAWRVWPLLHFALLLLLLGDKGRVTSDSDGAIGC